ncbi:MAG: hypothetical protein L6Q97_16235 [Thermoanaerobaculia bacterium]|nr:hypothetical protein [Thermoanaerobaculia bacterium]
MPEQSEEARIEAEVQKRLEAIVAEQQKQFAAIMETAMKNAQKGLDKANAALAREQKKLEAELDRARELRRKAELEGEKMAGEAYEKHRLQYDEAAKIKVLRDLARRHIEAGKPNSEIADWLGVEQDFVENIRVVVERVEKFYAGRQPKRTIPAGNPRVSFQDYGRGGTVFFESSDAKFEMWWEMGINALAIVDIPPPDRWEARTGLPLARRDEILHFIGAEIVARQTVSGGSFVVGENVLTIYANAEGGGTPVKAHSPPPPSA